MFGEPLVVLYRMAWQMLGVKHVQHLQKIWLCKGLNSQNKWAPTLPQI